MPPGSLGEKYRVLVEILRASESAALGFSGGVDSTFLAAVTRAVLGKENCVAYLALSPSLAQSEREEAESLSRLLDIVLIAFNGTEFQNPEYLANAGDRCFHCKDDLYLHLSRFAAGKGYRHLFYGGNTDDLSDFRPGIKAAEKHGARAPLAEAGLNKDEIREMSRLLRLPTWDKPAMPCLSSRIPYGQRVTAEKLSRVERAEAVLRDEGFRECRVRHDGDEARIEIPSAQMPLLHRDGRLAGISGRLMDLGFRKVTVNPHGFRSGSLNAALSPEAKARLIDKVAKKIESN